MRETSFQDFFCRFRGEKQELFRCFRGLNRELFRCFRVQKQELFRFLVLETYCRSYGSIYFRCEGRMMKKSLWKMIFFYEKIW